MLVKIFRLVKFLIFLWNLLYTFFFSVYYIPKYVYVVCSLKIFLDPFLDCISSDFRTEVRGDFNIHGTKYFQDAVFHQKSIYDAVSLLYLWLAKKLFQAFSVITSHVNISWRAQVFWPTKGTGGLQHHKCLIFDVKQHPKNIWFRGC